MTREVACQGVTATWGRGSRSRDTGESPICPASDDDGRRNLILKWHIYYHNTHIGVLPTVSLGDGPSAHEKRRRKRVSQRRGGRHHRNQGAALHWPAAAGIDDVPVAFAVDFERLFPDAADAQRLVVQDDRTVAAPVIEGVADAHLEAAPVRPPANGQEATGARAEQGRWHAVGSHLLAGAIERVAFADA